jgi:LPXTG-motif cell wall-anchored protein
LPRQARYYSRVKVFVAGSVVTKDVPSNVIVAGNPPCITERREESMWWFVIMILGIIAFALFIDWRRKKNNNNKHTPGTNPSTKSGESSNYQSGEGRDW